MVYESLWLQKKNITVYLFQMLIVLYYILKRKNESDILIMINIIITAYSTDISINPHTCIKSLSTSVYIAKNSIDSVDKW